MDQSSSSSSSSNKRSAHRADLSQSHPPAKQTALSTEGMLEKLLSCSAVSATTKEFVQKFRYKCEQCHFSSFTYPGSESCPQCNHARLQCQCVCSHSLLVGSFRTHIKRCNPLCTALKMLYSDVTDNIPQDANFSLLNVLPSFRNGVAEVDGGAMVVGLGGIIPDDLLSVFCTTRSAAMSRDDATQPRKQPELQASVYLYAQTAAGQHHLHERFWECFRSAEFFSTSTVSWRTLREHISTELNPWLAAGDLHQFPPHCNGAGFKKPRGALHRYINWGVLQPLCSSDHCHSAALELYRNHGRDVPENSYFLHRLLSASAPAAPHVVAFVCQDAFVLKKGQYTEERSIVLASAWFPPSHQQLFPLAVYEKPTKKKAKALAVELESPVYANPGWIWLLENTLQELGAAQLTHDVVPADSAPRIIYRALNDTPELYVSVGASRDRCFDCMLKPSQFNVADGGSTPYTLAAEIPVRAARWQVYGPLRRAADSLLSLQKQVRALEVMCPRNYIYDLPIYAFSYFNISLILASTLCMFIQFIDFSFVIIIT